MMQIKPIEKNLQLNIPSFSFEYLHVFEHFRLVALATLAQNSQCKYGVEFEIVKQTRGNCEFLHSVHSVLKSVHVECWDIFEVFNSVNQLQTSQ